MVCVCVPPFTGEFEFTVGSSLSLVVDIMNLPAIGRPAASLARQNCQCTAFFKRKSNVYVKNHETSDPLNFNLETSSGVILLKVYKFFPKKDQNQTTF